jgi:hypothetical protein
MAAPTLSVGPNVDISRAMGDQNEASLAINPTNPLNIVAASNDLPAAFSIGAAGRVSVSNDGGVTWTSRIVGNASDGLAVSGDGDPFLAFDQFGNLFFAFLDITSPTTDAIDVILSTDGGATFQRLAVIDTGNVDQPTIATGSGMVWVTYGSVFTQSDGTTVQQIRAAGAADTDLGVVGAFTKPLPVSSPTNQVLFPSNFGGISIGPQGQVLVSFQVPSGGPIQTGMYTALNTGGLNGTFAQGIPIDLTNELALGSFFIPAQNSSVGIVVKPRVVYDNSNGPHRGRVYAYYLESPSVGSTEQDIIVRHSDNNGATWSPAVKVNDDKTTNSHFFPQAAVDPSTGVLAIAWYDCRNAGAANNTTQIFAAVSDDGGNTFTANVQVSAGTSNSNLFANTSAGGGQGFGDYYAMDFLNGVFYPIWGDNSTSLVGNPDVPQLDIAVAAVTVTIPPVFPAIVAVAPQAGGGPFVQIFNAQNGTYMRTIQAYPADFLGGVRVAVGDLFGTGQATDVVTAPGPGGSPDIRVWDGITGQMLQEFMAYDFTFLGGVFVAVGDVTRGNAADIITAPDAGGGPLVRVFLPEENDVLFRQFFAYTPSFFGGVRLAARDVNRDGYADIITGAGPGGGPHVKVFSGLDNSVLLSFYAYAPSFLGGVNVAAGFVTPNGHADIITGAGPGGGSQVNVFDGITGALVETFAASTNGPLFANDFVQGGGFLSGVQVSTVNLGDTVSDIVVSMGPLSSPIVKIFDPISQVDVESFLAFDPTVLTGLYVGGHG